MTAKSLTEQSQLSQSPCVQTPLQSTRRNNGPQRFHVSFIMGGLQSAMQRGIWGKEKELPPGGSGRACFLSWGLKDRRTSKEVNAEDLSEGEDYVNKVGGGDEWRVSRIGEASGIARSRALW